MFPMNTAMVAFACALGAFAGTLIAQDFDYFWGFGALAGGIVSYFSYDPKGVLNAAKQAWKETRKTVKNDSYRRRVKIQFIRLLYNLSFGYGVVTWCLSAILLVVLISGIGVTPIDEVLITMFLVGILPFVGGTVPVVLPFLLFGMFFIITPKKVGIKGIARNIREGRKDLRKVNVFTIPVLVILALVRATRSSLTHLPKVKTAVHELLQFVGHFCKRTFLYVHTQERLLCLVDGTIGACIGYAAGNALIGAVAGLLLGVLNYEILSVRVFKLAPRRR